MNSYLYSTRIGAWINLCRIPNLPTAWSNILMGSWLARQDFYPLPPLVLLLAASSCFYVAGMILNDVFDYRRDCEQRPERPIPAGLISLQAAMIAAILLLVGGSGLGIAAAWQVQTEFAGMLRSVLVVGSLPVAILLYDKGLKQTVLAPIAMGVCRSLNVLLGATAGSLDSESWLGFSGIVWFAAAVIGLYVCGITWFAREETRKDVRRPLIVGSILIGLAILVMQLLPLIWPVGGTVRQLAIHGFLLAALILLCWRLGRAIYLAKPEYIQQAVVTCLFSLILIDALFTLVATPEQPLAALIVAMLIVPANFLGKFFRPT